MKALKISIITILLIFFALYLGFLFVLPSKIDLNKYSKQIENQIEKQTGFQILIKDLEVKTSWNLSIGTLVKKADFKYPNGEKFAQVNNLDVKLSLLPILWGDLKLDSISLDKAIVKLKTKKSGNFILEDYLKKSIDKNAQKPCSLPFNLKPSDHMPVIKINKYKISFVEENSTKIYSIKGSDLKINDFILNKKIKIKTAGDIILDNKKQISYNLKIQSGYFPTQTNEKEKTTLGKNLMSLFKDLHKYDLQAQINADLKIKNDNKKPAFDGDVDIDKISFSLNGLSLPQSSVKLKIKNDEIHVNSNFYTGVNKKALITGLIKTGNKKYVHLRVKTNKTDLKNSFLLANSLFELFGNHNLKGISAQGDLKADFEVKSNFKTLQSEGYLKIENANITHKLYNANLKSINADLDFSKNTIRIKKSNAILNGEEIKLKGSIDTNANSNLNLSAENIQLKGLLATLGQIKTLKENEISGIISFNAAIKGRLDKAVPLINGSLKNVSLYNKTNKIKIKLEIAKLNAKSDGKKTQGAIEVKNLTLIPKGKSKPVIIPQITLRFNEKDLSIEKTFVSLNSSKLSVQGTVKDYSSSNPKFDIESKGLLKSSDIKTLLPDEYKKGVKAYGKIPVLIKISGNGVVKIHVQAMANPKNNLCIFDIDSIKGKTSLINADLTLDNDILKINEITMYLLKTNRGISEDLKANTRGGLEIAKISGKISNLESPSLEGVHIDIPSQIATSIPGFSDSLVKVKGDLYFDGPLKNPMLRGYAAIPYLHIPSIKTEAKNLVLNLSNNSIVATCPQLTIADSTASFNTIISNYFQDGLIITYADIKSNYFNLDSITQVLSQIPQGNSELKFKIKHGKCVINRFKSGGMIATNVSTNIFADNSIIKLSNLRADAFLGKIAGDISYNIKTNKINTQMQGRSINAELAVKALTGNAKKMYGQLDFDSDLSMSGSTPQQLSQSLNGNLNFILSNGKMSTLGKLEHLLYAQNIISNSILGATLNVVAKAVTVKNTGYYKYMKGQLNFDNGWANIRYIKTSGPTMSMYITGRYYLINNFASLTILGKVSDDVVRLLGPIGEFSVNKIISNIPKLGEIRSGLINQLTSNPDYENTDIIPNLTPQTNLPTKNFKVVISGNMEIKSSIKSFKWLSKPKTLTQNETTETQPNHAKSIYNQTKKIITTPDFINDLPDLKNE